VLFVHGSIVGGEATWAAQRALAARWTLLVLERRGFGASPDAEREDFEVDAADIEAALGDGAHLVAHSYGAIGALIAAAERPQAVKSLTLVEPVALTVAVRDPAVQSALVELIELNTSGPREPRVFLGDFLRLMGLQVELPPQLPPPMERATRLLMNARPPFSARLRLDELVQAGIPTLVVSGAHSDVFEAICDGLAERIGAERAVIAGAQHAVPAVGDAFNKRLERFLVGATAARH
jgi:pimeloyl-ACP methyl ester carboxylesterase